jgi:ABC-type transport system involved in cytochrome c biogenesis permease subunit
MTQRTAWTMLILAGMVISGAAICSAQTPSPPPGWTPKTLELFSTLPVQDGGRVKPLDTYAAFKLLKFHGRRSLPGSTGQTLTPMEWLLDCLFHPDAAREYKVFRVDNDEVITAIGIEAKKKRDYYSYTELAAGRAKLLELGHQYMRKEEGRRTVVETELMTLAMNLREFEDLVDYTEFARRRIPVSDSQKFGELFPGQTECRLSEVLNKAPQIFAAYTELRSQPTGNEAEFQALTKSLQKIEEVARGATALALFPPPAGADSDEWLTPADLVNEAFGGQPLMVKQLNLLAGFEEVVAASDTPADFDARVAAFHEAATSLAQTRGEYRRIPLEVTFYRLKLFYYALVFYVLSFLLVAAVWMRPQSRWLGAGAYVAVLVPTVLLVAGITLRCIIRERPPVTTLYETILFVTAVAVAITLFMEWVNRQGVALSLGAVLGMAGMFLANKYEVREGSDTMVSMVAVLNTNFWLATHVTTITIGYAAGLLAGGLAHIFVLGKLFGVRRKDPAFYRGLTRLVYGSLCFSLLFSVVGTVLGGIWANESWGRFWGWDPKENGALMIVLWQLFILHGRMGGFLKNYGVNIAAIIGGMVVAFSWFGVNMLGVGLHSYGFASGAYTALMSFYAGETLVSALGCYAWFRERHAE